jgi:hypothetical protein
MKRRRLVLVIGTLAVAAAGAWWLSLDRLSEEERQLVGRWVYGPTYYRGTGRWEFGPDRQTFLGEAAPGPSGIDMGYGVSGRWSFRDGVIRIDTEPSAVRRALRPVAARLNIYVGRVQSFAVTEVTADQLVTEYSSGGSQVWTRATSE